MCGTAAALRGAVSRRRQARSCDHAGGDSSGRISRGNGIYKCAAGTGVCRPELLPSLVMCAAGSRGRDLFPYGDITLVRVSLLASANL